MFYVTVTHLIQVNHGILREAQSRFQETNSSFDTPNLTINFAALLLAKSPGRTGKHSSASRASGSIIVPTSPPVTELKIQRIHIFFQTRSSAAFVKYSTFHDCIESFPPRA
jgi:hypothetical protein